MDEATKARVQALAGIVIAHRLSTWGASNGRKGRVRIVPTGDMIPEELELAAIVGGAPAHSVECPAWLG